MEPSEHPKPTTTDETEYVEGRYHPIEDWQMDTKGYFLIRLKKEEGVIELGYCRRKNVIEVVITGKTPQEIYFTAIERGLLSRMDHAAYLGKELEKAHLAMKNGLEYIQDEELKIN